MRFTDLSDFFYYTAISYPLVLGKSLILPIIYRKMDHFGTVIAAGAFISLCIELMQLPFATRVTDIDDLILNTLGVMIGYGIYSLVKKIKTSKR